ncbi:MAG: hypothetical protein ACKKMP_01770 [Candidatus Nealsonbacteria bacterium]
MTEEDLLERVELKKEETIKEAEILDGNVLNLDRVEKANKIIYFAEKHISLCKVVIEKSDKLFKTQTKLWDAESAGKKAEIDKCKKNLGPLEKSFKEAKLALLKQKQKYPKDKDLKKELKSLSKVPEFLKENYN